MKRLLPILAAAVLVAQPDKEQKELQEALAEAGSSQVDFMRALERHLTRYPNTTQRSDIERALVRAAMEARDSARIVKYGELLLARESGDIDLIERVTRNLLASEEKAQSEKALKYAKRLEENVELVPRPAKGERNAARRTEEIRLLLGKAYVYQSRATGNLGKLAEAEALARKSYETYPTAEGAREVARWLDRQQKTGDALPFLAEAFMIPDSAATPLDRARDRNRLGEWHAKAGPATKPLGDLVLAAYDLAVARVERHRESLRALDVNAEADSLATFTITGLDGSKLAFASLKGKVVVLDFWATWCGPCRAQLPLYQQVEAKYKSNPDVVFLNINTDENKEIVKPFLDANKWGKRVYFEDGLSLLLKVSSIPTTIIVDRRGEIASRMNGFLADRFTEMLIERIEQSLSAK